MFVNRQKKKLPCFHRNFTFTKKSVTINGGEPNPDRFSRAAPLRLREAMAMKVKKLTVMALLCAIALTIFMIEAQIPPVIPIPGV